MKQQIIPGQTYRWLPELIQGLDGKFYHVYTMFSSGRGWAAKKYLTPTIHKDTGNVIVRALHTNIYGDHNKRIISVNIIKGTKLKVLTFNKRPYIRKSDGKFSVTYQDYFKTLGDQYGVTKLKGVPDWIKDYYQADITAGLIVQDKIHYITNILSSNGNLIKE